MKMDKMNVDLNVIKNRWMIEICLWTRFFFGRFSIVGRRFTTARPDHRLLLRCWNQVNVSLLQSSGQWGKNWGLFISYFSSKSTHGLLFHPLLRLFLHPQVGPRRLFSLSADGESDYCLKWPWKRSYWHGTWLSVEQKGKMHKKRWSTKGWTRSSNVPWLSFFLWIFNKNRHRPTFGERNDHGNSVKLGKTR